MIIRSHGRPRPTFICSVLSRTMDSGKLAHAWLRAMPRLMFPCLGGGGAGRICQVMEGDAHDRAAKAARALLQWKLAQCFRAWVEWWEQGERQPALR
jgi:hypothetical protein